MNNDPDVVLKTENGIISMALYVYAQTILSVDGDESLYERAMNLYYKFRDLDNKDEQTTI